MSSSAPLKALFDKMNQNGGETLGAPPPKQKKKAAVAKENENMDEFFIPESGAGEGKASKKRLSIERIYQKKTQLEHILLRPDTYIGSVESVTQPMWVLNEDMDLMIQRDITYVPGLYKIFDEILVNAADNKQRDPKMNCIKIDIDPAANKIRVWNNGRGIPVVEHKEHNMFVPTMIFGHLLTSSNYDDSEKKVTGGRNGYGAKLCNIFSKKFVVETSYKEYKKGFRQTWQDNMGKTKEPSITDAKEEDFTAITFYPDLEKFRMETLDKDTVDLFTRRAYDIAAASRDVKVILNGKRIPVKNFRDYVSLFIKDKVDEAGAPIKLVHEIVSPRWEVAVTMSDKGFQQASFVNSIATTKGGRHVDHVADQVVKKLIEVVSKKNKGGIQIKPFQVKNHLWLFVNCLIENPTFDSQTKENMTLQAKSFGSKCQLSEKFITQVSKCGIVESIQSWMKFKAQSQLKKVSGNKQNKLKGIPKLDDANDAGTKHSLDCTLILTEGDSAKTLAVAGLGVVGRDRYGVFPLRGKVLNVREASHKQIMENAEINNVVKIMGLQFNKKYEEIDQLKTLRYGKIMIMTDQDQDGSHIKGLLINFLQHFWPNLLKHNVVNQFITPIVKVTKGKEEHAFYSLPEFEEWKSETSNWNAWKIKYYKGLGTSTSKEAKEYFSDMRKHKIDFKYSGAEDDASINLAFNKKKVDERKEWLSHWMEEKKRRAEMGLPALYLYGKNTRSVTFNDFINRELILFSNADLERSIPSMVDGLKPGQRKVLFTCIKRNFTNREIKVAQLAGSVAELSAYHHGETSLMSTIIGLAQNFVGSNNLNLLQPIGQFGTRLHGGKDASSPRYIFTMLSPLTKLLFHVNDEPLLNFLYDDNLRIEPEWYCPIIPMVLINGAEGIGTGWSTKIPNYDVREIVANIKRMIDGEEPETMLPSYKNFKGSIYQLIDNKYVVNGEVSIIDDQTVEITELPVRKWTQDYKEDVIESMANSTEKTPQLITDYKEYHTDTTVKFVVKMTSQNLAKAEEQGLHKVFKLQNTITSNSMVLFDRNGCIKKYNSVEEILREFFEVRSEMYRKRKAYLEGMLAAESLKFDNIARFIMEKIEGTVTIENKKKKDLVDLLVRRGYDSDPVKAWKDAQNKGKKKEVVMIDDDLYNEKEEEEESGPDFNYILNMPLWCLTKERKDELCGKRDAKAKELSDLRRKTPTDLWRDDLEEFLQELDKVEQQERDDDFGVIENKKAGKSKKPKKIVEEVKPSPIGRRIEPRFDSIKKKAEGTKRSKEKKEAKNGNILDFMKMEDEESNEPLSLADRLKLKGSPVDVIKGGKETKVAAQKKEPKAPRQKKSSASPKKKGGKKRNPWSDDSADEISDVSDDDMDGSFLGTVIPRDGPRRAAAKQVKYNFEAEDEIESDGEGSVVDNLAVVEDQPAVVSDVSDGDSDFEAPVEKSKPANQKKAMVIESDSDDDDNTNTVNSSKEDKDDEWLRITGQLPDKSSQSTNSEPMFDDSDVEEVAQPKEELFKPVKSLKADKKPAAKKPAAEKKPRAPAKSKTQKKDSKQPGISAAFSQSSTAAKSKKVVTISDSDDDSTSHKEPKEKKAAPKKKKKNPWSSDESEDEKPKKAAVKKRTNVDLSDSDGESAPKKSKTTKKKKKYTSDESFSASDQDNDFVSTATTARGGGRARANVKYNFGEDSEEEDF
ncbi:DNA topoisomerase 2-alpha-like isoform X3 [Ruditapes philippinarum]|uniref:DNA topoisomerase 2-alpha-like isoform X3 n=1 Tax=Ruditapes philippinarum TaxID=129788 RepID=UPI00295B5EAB|nr:DNA topoisomerase 2-alpha-like isoform X3 [Ruditapes philippinarum]